MYVQWGTCGGGNWCSFNDLILPLSGEPHGVYVIWHEGIPGRVVYIGQGDISDRIKAHRHDRRITQYESNGTLRVTWAEVSLVLMPGVERFLADSLDPLVGERHSDADPMPVNLPMI